MRRTLLYTGGLLFAAAASLALAGPASAATKAPAPSWSPQYLSQSAWNTQVTLNDIGNTQLGYVNYNDHNSANSLSYIGQSGTNWHY